MCCFGGGDNLLAAFFLCDGTPDGGCYAARIAYFLYDCCCVTFMRVVIDCDLVSQGGEPDCDGFTDAARCAGNECVARLNFRVGGHCVASLGSLSFGLVIGLVQFLKLCLLGANETDFQRAMCDHDCLRHAIRLGRAVSHYRHAIHA